MVSRTRQSAQKVKEELEDKEIIAIRQTEIAERVRDRANLSRTSSYSDLRSVFTDDGWVSTSKFKDDAVYIHLKRYRTQLKRLRDKLINSNEFIIKEAEITKRVTGFTPASLGDHTQIILDIFSSSGWIVEESNTNMVYIYPMVEFIPEDEQIFYIRKSLEQIGDFDK